MSTLTTRQTLHELNRTEGTKESSRKRERREKESVYGVYVCVRERET